MGLSAAQDFWLAGSRFYFRRKATSTKDYPLIDMGVIQPASPAFDIAEAELQDSDGGILRTVAKQVTSIDEAYDITCSNLNPQNRAIIWLGDEPEAFTQSATPVTNSLCVNKGIVGGLFQLEDSSGIPLSMVASIQAIDWSDATPSAITLVVNEDYEVVNLERGIIRILAGGATNNLTLGDALELTIDYTLTALSGNRLIKPQIAQTVEGLGILWYGRDNNARQTRRDFDVSLIPQTTNIDVENWSNFVIRATVLSDPLDTSYPAGRMIDYKGDLPDVS